MRSYQPIWGDPRSAYQRECSDRYGPIRDLASRYNRTFSVLDIGGNFGWFDFALLSEFDCTCVIVDKKPIAPLIDQYGKKSAYWLDRHLTGDELLRLSKSENFDIVLGLSVLHHIKDYEKAFEGLLSLGSYVFIETQGDDGKHAAGHMRHDGINNLVSSHERIAQFKSHLTGKLRPMYLIEGEPLIEEQTLDASQRGAPTYGKYTIESDFDTCRITIDRSARPTPLPLEVRDFVPGMNLHNFRLLGGKVAFKPDPSHPDNHPWNYVLGRGGIIAIDRMNKKKWGTATTC